MELTFTPSSSVIAQVRYETSAHTLTVSLHSGRTYTYEAVPRSIYEQFLVAPSAGKFWNQFVRGVY